MFGRSMGEVMRKTLIGAAVLSLMLSGCGVEKSIREQIGADDGTDALALAYELEDRVSALEGQLDYGLEDRVSALEGQLDYGLEDRVSAFEGRLAYLELQVLQ